MVQWDQRIVERSPGQTGDLGGAVMDQLSGGNRWVRPNRFDVHFPRPRCQRSWAERPAAGNPLCAAILDRATAPQGTWPRDSCARLSMLPNPCTWKIFVILSFRKARKGEVRLDPLPE